MKWPPSNNRKAWEEFDEDCNRILISTLGGSVDRKLEIMSTIIYTIGADRFGMEEGKKSQRVNQSRIDEK